MRSGSRWKLLRGQLFYECTSTSLNEQNAYSTRCSGALICFCHTWGIDCAANIARSFLVSKISRAHERSSAESALSSHSIRPNGGDIEVGLWYRDHARDLGKLSVTVICDCNSRDSWAQAARMMYIYICIYTLKSCIVIPKTTSPRMVFCKVKPAKHVFFSLIWF